MKINWFEGGRRITSLMQGIIVIGCLSYVVLSSARDELVLETSFPDQPFTISRQDCEYGRDARDELLDYKIGTELMDVTLCFRAAPTNKGRLAIAYAPADKPGSFWMADQYSSAVTEYVNKRSTEFSPTADVVIKSRDARDARWWAEKAQQFKDAFEFGAIGCVVLWLFSSLIGWIIRGFAGVKSGQDFKDT
jgi:hypothetical protein